MVKVFETNKNGKNEITRAELESMLNEAWTEGYNKGKENSTPYYWWYPWSPTNPNYYITSNTNPADEGRVKPGCLNY